MKDSIACVGSVNERHDVVLTGVAQRKDQGRGKSR